MKNDDVKKKVIQYMNDNLDTIDKIKKYFKDRKWSVDDFKQTEWTHNTEYNIYCLGKEKNHKGECINCNGIMINAGNSNTQTFVMWARKPPNSDPQAF